MPDAERNGADSPASPQPLFAALGDALADARGLIESQARMARAEAGRNARVIGGGAAMVAIGILLLSVAIVFLAVAAVVALAALIGLLWSLLAIAFVSALAAVLLMALGRSRIASQPLLPQRSIARIRGDLQRLGGLRGKSDSEPRGKGQGGFGGI